MHVFFWLWALLSSLGLSAQDGYAGRDYFSFDVELPLGPGNTLGLGQQGDIAARLDTGARIVLVPPDMARIEARHLLRIETDTLPQAAGTARCLSTCQLDTLFLGPELFWLDVRVEVPFYADGTYEGTSRLGQEALSALGERWSRQPEALRIEGVDPVHQPLASRRAQLRRFDPPATFPLARGDIAEVRLIPGSGQARAQARLAALGELLVEQPLFGQDTSVEDQLPRAKALARLTHPVTVRFFANEDEARAQALAAAATYLLGLPPSAARVENMLPAFGGVSPRTDYLEIWVQ